MYHLRNKSYCTPKFEDNARCVCICITNIVVFIVLPYLIIIFGCFSQFRPTQYPVKMSLFWPGETKHWIIVKFPLQLLYFNYLLVTNWHLVFIKRCPKSFLRLIAGCCYPPNNCPQIPLEFLLHVQMHHKFISRVYPYTNHITCIDYVQYDWVIYKVSSNYHGFLGKTHVFLWHVLDFNK